ncbi:TPA: hypothetical protein ACM3ZM_004702 [Escherichia coli]|uniref:hypothetical protein n=1 Tax=Escherichia coli TaxID=562 RepID=UPI000A19F53E|nr:hypothetical protein [Escherichia coli]MCD6922350.1 hypothetical protein [Escherichia coli]MCR1088273.1 hypothetical protein [Escherichia coli]MCR1094470.1 hypothetical protein [Escherichia coli]HAJ1302806.1 hypothetical protein [Escherichia coli]HAJ1405713.1 hypothetical protein [Escherichia coli]
MQLNELIQLALDFGMDDFAILLRNGGEDLLDDLRCQGFVFIPYYDFGSEKDNIEYMMSGHYCENIYINTTASLEQISTKLKPTNQSLVHDFIKKINR